MERDPDPVSFGVSVFRNQKSAVKEPARAHAAARRLGEARVGASEQPSRRSRPGGQGPPGRTGA